MTATGARLGGPRCGGWTRRVPGGLRIGWVARTGAWKLNMAPELWSQQGLGGDLKVKYVPLEQVKSDLNKI
eukprot:s631_g35.t1